MDPGFDPKERLRWLSVGVLLQTGREAVLSKIFGEFVDRRELQAIEPIDPETLEIVDLSDRDELWVDYVSDAGDGFDAAAAIASLVGRTEPLALDGGEALGPAPLLVLGGDEAYPYGSPSGYRDRLVGPYRAMLPWSEPERAVVAVPGNHDWYDGLVSFLRVFCQGRWMGGWRTRQKRSYFAVKLPHGWWLWGIDIQFDADIDEPQLEYFRAVAQRVAPGDGIVLCWAKPSWVDAGRGNPGTYAQLEFLERTVIDPTGAKVRIALSGDSHHYARYEQPGTGEQRITAGGGGAYLSATHHLPPALVLPPPDLRDPSRRPPATYAFRESFPSAARSRSLSAGVLWRIYANRTFYLVPTALYLVLATALYDAGASVAGDRGGPLTLTPLLVTALVLGLVGLGLRAFASDDRDRSWLRWVAALGHLALHLAVIVGVLALARDRPAWGADSETASAAVIAVAVGLVVVPVAGLALAPKLGRARRRAACAALGLALVAVLVTAAWWLTTRTDQFAALSDRTFAGVLAVAVGAAVGPLVVAGYLLLAGLVDVNTNELFSAQAIRDHKSFVALHVTADGVAIHPVGVERVPRRWDPTGTEAGPWFAPRAGEEVAPRRIEPPVRVSREAPAGQDGDRPGAPARPGEDGGPVYQLTALYNHPEDAAAFDKHYDEVHSPLGAKIPGVQRFTVSRPGPDAEGNQPAYHLIAVLEWADEASFGAGMGGAEGQAAVDDLPNFAGAGVTLLTGPSNQVS